MRILLVLLVAVSSIAPRAKAAELPRSYVSLSGCAAAFNSPVNRYGIRLDKTRRARLEAYVFKDKTILTIVRHKSDSDQCGIVRDVVISRPGHFSFVFECLDKRNPSAVVVGTWPENHPGVSGPAVEAWRVNLEELRFVHVNTPVACYSRSYPGADEGGDLASWARKRTVR